MARNLRWISESNILENSNQGIFNLFVEIRFSKPFLEADRMMCFWFPGFHLSSWWFGRLLDFGGSSPQLTAESTQPIVAKLTITQMHEGTKQSNESNANSRRPSKVFFTTAEKHVSRSTTKCQRHASRQTQKPPSNHSCIETHQTYEKNRNNPRPTQAQKARTWRKRKMRKEEKHVPRRPKPTELNRVDQAVRDVIDVDHWAFLPRGSRGKGWRQLAWWIYLNKI